MSIYVFIVLVLRCFGAMGCTHRFWTSPLQGWKYMMSDMMMSDLFDANLFQLEGFHENLFCCYFVAMGCTHRCDMSPFQGWDFAWLSKRTHHSRLTTHDLIPS